MAWQRCAVIWQDEAERGVLFDCWVDLCVEKCLDDLSVMLKIQPDRV